MPKYIDLWKSEDAGLTSFFHLTTEFLMIPCGAPEGPSVNNMALTGKAAWNARLKAKSAGGIIPLKRSLVLHLQDNRF